jgi:long-chain acyl-CoA synthetase
VTSGPIPGPRVLVHHLLERSAEECADEVALVADGRELSYAELDHASAAVAAWLQASGVRRGDRVAVMMENSAELVISLYGVSRAGGVYVAINPTTKGEELEYLFGDCGVRVLIAESRCARAAAPVLPRLPGIVASAWVGGVPEGVDGAADFALLAGAGGVPVDPGLIDNDLVTIIYTSGSTGRPKGVMLTHRNVHHSVGAITAYLGLRADDVIESVLQMSFGYGLFQALLAAQVGATLVVERSFAFPYDVLRRMVEHRVTVFPAVPTIIATVLQLSPSTDLDLSAVRIVTSAAAAVPPAHIVRLAEVLPNASFFSMYGQTECTRATYLDPNRLHDKVGSVGKAIPNTEVYVVDPEGRRVPPGEVGELVVRGASVMRGYWGKPEATAERLREGDIPGEVVLYTGDEFRADDEGFLYFVGRMDDVFKCRGEKVSPKEVEHVLFELDEVLEAAVVGVPDPVDGTAVKALVVLRPGAEISERALRRHCQGRLQSHLVPRFIEIRDDLPKTDSGKIRRVALK